MEAQLEALAVKQGTWSKTANRLKSDLQGARRIALALSIIGALLAVIATQATEVAGWFAANGAQPGQLRLWLASTSAVCFAIVTLLKARELGAEGATAWVRARAAAEALKREAYTYAAQCCPYDDVATRGTLLRKAVQQIEAGVDDLVVEQIQTPAGSTPVEILAPGDYVERRVKRQIETFFEPRAATLQRTGRRLRRVEFMLALATSCITALGGVMEKGAGAHFDIVSLTAFFTALSGAVVAHIEASRYEFIVASYRATARRLRDALLDLPADVVAPSPAWSAFVNECEAILSEENSSWVAKIGRRASPETRPH